MEEKTKTPFTDKVKAQLKILWGVIKEQANQLLTFVKENPLVSVAIMGLIKSVLSNSNRFLDRYHEQRRRDCGFYDDSLRRWCYSKRRPSKYQADEIEWRRKQGESYRSILEDMGLLKR